MNDYTMRAGEVAKTVYLKVEQLHLLLISWARIFRSGHTDIAKTDLMFELLLLFLLILRKGDTTVEKSVDQSARARVALCLS